MEGGICVLQTSIFGNKLCLHNGITCILWSVLGTLRKHPRHANTCMWHFIMFIKTCMHSRLLLGNLITDVCISYLCGDSTDLRAWDIFVFATGLGCFEDWRRLTLFQSYRNLEAWLRYGNSNEVVISLFGLELNPYIHLNYYENCERSDCNKFN